MDIEAFQVQADHWVFYHKQNFHHDDDYDDDDDYYGYDYDDDYKK